MASPSSVTPSLSSPAYVGWPEQTFVKIQSILTDSDLLGKIVTIIINFTGKEELKEQLDDVIKIAIRDLAEFISKYPQPDLNLKYVKGFEPIHAFLNFFEEFIDLYKETPFLNTDYRHRLSQISPEKVAAYITDGSIRGFSPPDQIESLLITLGKKIQNKLEIFSEVSGNDPEYQLLIEVLKSGFWKYEITKRILEVACDEDLLKRLMLYLFFSTASLIDITKEFKKRASDLINKEYSKKFNEIIAQFGYTYRSVHDVFECAGFPIASRIVHNHSTTPFINTISKLFSAIPLYQQLVASKSKTSSPESRKIHATKFKEGCAAVAKDATFLIQNFLQECQKDPFERCLLEVLDRAFLEYIPTEEDEDLLLNFWINIIEKVLKEYVTDASKLSKNCTVEQSIPSYTEAVESVELPHNYYHRHFLMNTIAQQQDYFDPLSHLMMLYTGKKDSDFKQKLVQFKDEWQKYVNYSWYENSDIHSGTLLSNLPYGRRLLIPGTLIQQFAMKLYSKVPIFRTQWRDNLIQLDAKKFAHAVVTGMPLDNFEEKPSTLNVLKVGILNLFTKDKTEPAKAPNVPSTTPPSLGTYLYEPLHDGVNQLRYYLQQTKNSPESKQKLIEFIDTRLVKGIQDWLQDKFEIKFTGSWLDAISETSYSVAGAAAGVFGNTIFRETIKRKYSDKSMVEPPVGLEPFYAIIENGFLKDLLDQFIANHSFDACIKILFKLIKLGFKIKEYLDLPDAVKDPFQNTDKVLEELIQGVIELFQTFFKEVKGSPVENLILDALDEALSEYDAQYEDPIQDIYKKFVLCWLKKIMDKGEITYADRLRKENEEMKRFKSGFSY